jgi:hypothetical protein
MAKTKDSGRKRLLKGTLKYLWEEAKTMNAPKAKAMGTLLQAYVRMKRDKKEKPKASRKTVSPIGH